MNRPQKQLNSTYSIETDGYASTAVLSIESLETGEVFTTSWNTTKHCQERLFQRGISYKHMLMAMEFGEAHFKQGFIYYTVVSKYIPKSVSPKDTRLINNLVVVVSATGEIVTCYRSKNGIKHVKRKRKDLVRN